jgi:hypothetical protein
MTELKIEKATAKKIFPTSPDWFKTVLTDSFGVETFKKKSFKDIKTFEDACEELNIAPIFIDTNELDEIAYKKLKIIAAAINSGWVPDWENENQYKYYPYFKMSSGFGFSTSGYDCDYSDTGVGSRLCFETKEKAIHAGTQFTELYKDFLTI